MTYLDIENRLKEIEKELEKLPEGRLSKRNGYYTHTIGEKSVGITRNVTLIKQLCRKKFLEELQRHFKKATDSLKYFESLPLIEPISFIRTFSKSYQNLPIDYFYHTDIEEWKKAPFSKNTYPIENGYKTTKGVLVRSKSEFIIAEQLEKNDIPYRYDAAIKLSGKTKYPDFTIKNPFSGKLIIWEHFGALNESGYEKTMNEKMELYFANGFRRFHDLIYTFEFDIKSHEGLQKLVKAVLSKTN